jgi:hypothetical protein
MASGNASLGTVVALTGSAPDHRRAVAETLVASALTTAAANALAAGDAPSVVISASAIDIKIGDTLMGTIVGPDAKGNRYFIADQGIFAVDPQSALEGLPEATLIITRTSRGIEAMLLPPPGEATAPPQNVKLQLIQANVAALADTFDAQTQIASDNPVSVAENIATTLRQITQILPQGFALTPKVVPASQALLVAQATEIVTEVPDAPPSEVVATPIRVAALLSPKAPPQTLAPGTLVELALLAPADVPSPTQNLSLLADLPDDKTNRAAILQSPLLGALLKSGRLLVVATPASPQEPAQIVTSSAVLLPASLAETGAVTAARLAIAGDARVLPPQRLLVLISLADTKAAPPEFPAQALVLPGDTEVMQQLQSLFQSRSASAETSKPLPQLKDSLPAEILLLFHAVGRKLPAPALTRLALARYTVAAPAAGEQPVLEALRGLTRLTSGAVPATMDAPQRLVLPLHVGDQLLPLVLLFTPPEPRQEGTPDAESQSAVADGQTFALAIDFEHMGPLVLRGRCGRDALTLSIETRAPLPESLQESAKALFFESMAAADLTGQLRFAPGTVEGWQSHQPTL